MAWTWFALSRKARLAKSQGRSCRPSLESLEERVVMDVNYLPLTLDSTQSTATLSGMALGATFMEQGPGSLTDAYSGTLGVMYDDGVGTTGVPALEFVPASSVTGDPDVVAGISGTWMPDVGGATGSAPANYGATATLGAFTAFAAARNLVFTIDTSGQNNPFYVLTPDPVDPTSSHFDSTQTLTVTSGSIDYNVPFIAQGNLDITGASGANQATTQGTLTSNPDGSFQIVVPIQLHIETTFQGQPAFLDIQGAAVGDFPPPGGRSHLPTKVPTGNAPVGIAAASAALTDTRSPNLTAPLVAPTNNLDVAIDSFAFNFGASGYTKTSAAPDTSAAHSLAFVATDDASPVGDHSFNSFATVTIA